MLTHAALFFVIMLAIPSVPAVASSSERDDGADLYGEIQVGPKLRDQDLKNLFKNGREWSSKGDQEIGAGTTLNVVFDLRCLGKMPRDQGGWFRQRAEIAKPLIESRRTPSNHSNLYSTSINLEKPITASRLKREADSDLCLMRVASEGELLVQSDSRQERNRFRVGLETGDPRLSQQDHLAFTSWTRVWERYLKVQKRVAPPTIAIIDTGVDLTHPDLVENAWINRREIPGNGIDDDGNGYVDDINGYNFASEIGASGPEDQDDYFKHGTHVAGLAAARIGNGIGGSGVNGTAKIMSLNVFGNRKTSRIATLENAIRYAVDNGARVINLSIGGRESTTTTLDTIMYAVRRGAVIVAASGNNGIVFTDDPESPRYVTPAALGRSINGMISVTSVDTQTGMLSSFANFSLLSAEIAAPGAFRSGKVEHGLLSTFPGNSYGFLAGTSMAAPVVSGAVALIQSWLIAGGRTAYPARVEEALIKGSRVSDRLYGVTYYGRALDFGTLVKYLETAYPLPNSMRDR